MINSFRRFLRSGLRSHVHSTSSHSRRRRDRKPLTSESLETRSLLTATLQTFLTTEHVDINMVHQNPNWSIEARDADNSESYAADDALLYVGTPAQTTRPAGSQFNFIGVGSGAQYYRLPQSQDPNLIFLGVAGYGVTSSEVDRYNPSAESKGRVSGNARWIKMTLLDVDHYTSSGSVGNGVFSAWQSGDSGPAVFMSSFNDGVSNANGSGLDVTDGISADDAIWVTANGHSHYNYGFSSPGRYEITFQLSAYFGDDGNANNSTPNVAGLRTSGPITTYFSVVNVGQIEFDNSSYSVNEDAGTASVRVRRVGGSDGQLTVNYSTSNGTATAGSDYSATSGTLTFLDRETEKFITIPISNDTDDEPSETIQLSLSTAGPSTIGGYYTSIEGRSLIGTNGTATLTILDNDEPANTPPSISDVIDQVTSEDVSTPAIGFTVGDNETAAGDLVVTATSSNTTLIPIANIVFGGSGANRTVTITPVANLSGSSTITLTVTDAGGLTSTDSFLLIVNSVNDPPTISDIANQSTDEDTATGAIPFVVGDLETPAADLVVTATSSNPTLIPDANIVLGGSGANRTVTITPAANLSGSATITITVTDANGASSSDTFVLNVGGVNDPPTISDIANQSTDEDTATGAIPFVVGDLETPAGDLVVTATSSNPALVPDGNIVLGGSGANRTVTITPAANLSGSATITITVTDATAHRPLTRLSLMLEV